MCRLLVWLQRSPRVTTLHFHPLISHSTDCQFRWQTTSSAVCPCRSVSQEAPRHVLFASNWLCLEAVVSSPLRGSCVGKKHLQLHQHAKINVILQISCKYCWLKRSYIQNLTTRYHSSAPHVPQQTGAGISSAASAVASIWQPPRFDIKDVNWPSPFYAQVMKYNIASERMCLFVPLFSSKWQI